MKKINTSPISGAQELLPAEQAVFNRLKNEIQEVYARHGFLNIETPVIDRCEILLAKAGGDTEKQIYKVIKTAEVEDKADQALRFDHTVPLSRYVVEHENSLAFPFQVSQVARNFRGERAQRGRFREFYQCDVDVIGRGSLPLYYDAEVITTLLEAFSRFGLTTPLRARLSNRKILTGLLNALGVTEQAQTVFYVVDHAEKVTLEETKLALKDAGLDEKVRETILQFIDIRGPREMAMQKLRELGVEDETFNEGVAELDEVMQLLSAEKHGAEIVADMRIVRGLDYYTGTVFEFNLPQYKEIGSVCGGGRYENLTRQFTEQRFPGVGGSIGLTRLFYVLTEHKIIESQIGRPIEYAIVPIGEEELEYSMKLARKLRAEGAVVMLVVSDKRLGDRLNYAARIARKGIVIGANEVQSGEYSVKEFV